MSFSGDLTGIGLADVFQNIAGNLNTGTLHVSWRRGERYLLFVEGRVAAVAARVKQRIPLLQHIRDRGYVSVEDLDAFLHKHRRSRKSPARLLVDQQLMTKEDVFGAMRTFVEDEIHELMRLREAAFTFQDGEPPGDVFDPDLLRAGIRLESGPMLIEGARRRDEWERITRLVSSDRDRFVALEGWDEYELTPRQAEIGVLLDGTVDVGSLVASVGGSRFDVLKDLVVLVQQGQVRRCSGSELQDFAQEAVANGDPELAIGLLQGALQETHGDPDLRLQLASLLEAEGRLQDAAAEHAVLGFQRMQEGESADALQHYELAVALDPGDVALQERRLELLVESGDVGAIRACVLQLTGLLEEMGLSDRAATVLDGVLDQTDLVGDLDLLARRGEIHRGLGQPEAAAKDFLTLAEALRKGDPERSLHWMREALAECPGDGQLAARIHDIESGAQEQRAKRLRRVMAGVITVAVVLALVVAGAVEIHVSHRVFSALEQGLSQPDSNLDGNMQSESQVAARLQALGDLESVTVDYPWLPAGQRAEAFSDRLVSNLRDLASELSEGDQQSRAVALLRDIASVVRRPEPRSACRDQLAVLEVRALEQQAWTALGELGGLAPEHSLVEARARQAIERVVALGDPRLVPMLTEALGTLEHPVQRAALLETLAAIGSPDAFLPVARFYLEDRFTDLDRTGMERLLELAAEQRGAGHEGRWRSIYPELDAAAQHSDPVIRGRSRKLLKLLRGDALGGYGR